MRKKITTILLLLNFGLAYSQAPQAVTYQAVATNAAGLELISSPIGVRASIIQGAINNPAQYIETFATKTDTFGLFTINVGQGIYAGGTLNNFAKINWGVGPFFLKIEMDATGGTNYAFMGTNQILSVPYALYALKADTANYVINSNTINDADIDSTNEIQKLSLSGDTLRISKGNYVILHDSIGGGSVYVPPINQPISISYLGTIIDVSPIDNGTYVQWGATTPSITGALNLGNGLLNTQAIVSALGNNGGVSYAAKVCDTLNAYGFNDWYLPSVQELDAMWHQSYLIPGFATYMLQQNPFPWWWSSTQYSFDPTQAIHLKYDVNGGGTTNLIGLTKSNSNLRVRCIRHH